MNSKIYFNNSLLYNSQYLIKFKSNNKIKIRSITSRSQIIQ